MHLGRILLALWFAASLPVLAHAERRAFIVGSADYENISDLQKTIADADGYEGLFGGQLNFEVSRLSNPTRPKFAAAFGEFLESIQPGDEIVFIFSGHGWSDGAENYLVMTDAPRDASEFVLKAETMPITSGILSQIKRRNPRMTLAIIDACRDYPFDSLTRGAFQKGMVRTDVSEGMLVLYAAGSGQKALDRLSNTDDSSYSVFTRVLLPKLAQTDRPLQDIAKDVKDEVRMLAYSINHSQRPAYYDELLGDYCLSGVCTSDVNADIDPETRYWLDVTSGSTCFSFQEYLKLYPNGRFAIRAQKLIDASPCAQEEPERSMASSNRLRDSPIVVKQAPKRNYDFEDMSESSTGAGASELGSGSRN